MSSPGDQLRALARKAETAGGRAAAHAMAQAGRDEMRDLLGRRSHPRGTSTPAPPGGPPARVSGRLQASVIATLPVQEGAGRWVATAGPHGVVYAVIQERGGTIHAHTPAGLRFTVDGRWVRTPSVRLPARPYASAAERNLRESGRLSEVGAAAFERAMA